MIINLIDRVKFSFRKDKELLSALHDILGFYPHNLEIFRVALAHKSQAYRNTSGRSLNNERLEFLGDAILEAVVSDIVFHRYERKREGFLTSTRSKIVQRASLNRLAREIGLERLVRTTASKNSHNCHIGGNAFEALIGAIYLDRGYRFCKWFVEKRIVGRLFDLDDVAREEVNFKSKLLEWTQKNRIEADYGLERTENPGSNNPVFSSVVTIEGLVAGKGTGYSKKESHQQAAKDALTKLRREPKFVDSIFRAKEKRTAMEAVEICALPKIAEIEEEIAKTKGRASGRRARRAPVVQGEAVADAQQKTAAAPAPVAEEGTAPKRRRGRPATKRAGGEGKAAAEAVLPVSGEAGMPSDAGTVVVSESPVVKEPADAKPGAEKKEAGSAPARKPRRRRPKSEKAGEAVSAPDNDRENIIKQAEEAAFQESTD